MGNAQDKFNIEVNFKGSTVPFQIRKFDNNGNSGAEVWKDGERYFTLECCTDEVGDTLKLSLRDENKGIDPILVRDIASVVESEEE